MAHVLKARAQRRHAWLDREITDDACRPRLSGGSVTLELGLSESLMRYIDEGV